jgi:hypothetical protein
VKKNMGLRREGRSLGLRSGLEKDQVPRPGGCRGGRPFRSPLAELSYNAAVRALDLQERGVEQLRARTGTLLAPTQAWLLGNYSC